ncbi:hypothetical protein F2Q69_00034318 [Brassica cretica]|uniref:Uncharacterized protein n=1 Tax=Brassica cretica TaxID=69181 RepID=A0A8S9SCH8_BRACR|nr:hypothetical protein F2Q69_00034318 [Brassica cretica]
MEMREIEVCVGDGDERARGLPEMEMERDGASSIVAAAYPYKSPPTTQKCPEHRGPMVKTVSFLHPDCKFESCMRELLHDVSRHPTRIWAYVLGLICIPGERVYPWTAPCLGD